LGSIGGGCENFYHLYQQIKNMIETNKNYLMEPQKKYGRVYPSDRKTSLQPDIYCMAFLACILP